MAEMVDTEVRMKIYELFVKTGEAPASREVAAALGRDPGDVSDAIARLGAGRAIVLDPETGEVLMANPLCATPTPFLVEVGERAYFGACIWDAIVAAMLKREARIRSSCSCCGRPMNLECRGGEMARADGVIHFGVPAREWWANIVFT